MAAQRVWLVFLCQHEETILQEVFDNEQAAEDYAGNRRLAADQWSTFYVEDWPEFGSAAEANQ